MKLTSIAFWTICGNHLRQKGYSYISHTVTYTEYLLRLHTRLFNVLTRTQTAITSIVTRMKLSTTSLWNLHITTLGNTGRTRAYTQQYYYNIINVTSTGQWWSRRSCHHVRDYQLSCWGRMFTITACVYSQRSVLDSSRQVSLHLEQLTTQPFTNYTVPLWQLSN